MNKPRGDPPTDQQEPRRRATGDPPTTQQGLATGDPTTTQQGVGGNDPPTTQQGMGADPRTDQQGGVGGDPPSGWQSSGESIALPVELLRHYEPLERLGNGMEGVVWRVRRREDDQVLALKVHSPQHPLDEALIAFIREHESIHEYAPRIEATGTATTPEGSVTWVAMEYLAHGSLTALLVGERTPEGGLPPERTLEIVEGLAEAIHAWQDAQRNPLDLKPDNLLIRQRAPLRLILGDLGGIVRLSISQQFGEFSSTLAYAPPEGMLGWQQPPWPWWSLGEIIYKMLTGNLRVTERFDILHDRTFGTAELPGITDDRWRLLLRGLLTREPAGRWMYQQVRAWLDGESPALSDDRHSGPAAQPTHSPIAFAGHDHHTAEDLAAALLDDLENAVPWLMREGQVLFEWLGNELKDKRFSRHTFLRQLSGDRLRAHRALTAFTATFLPEQRPRYRGLPIDAEGLLALADAGDSGIKILQEILGTDIPGNAVRESDILESAARSACPHPECEERCEVLVRAGRELPKIITETRQRLTELERRSAAGRSRHGPKETAALEPVAVRLTFAPRERARLLGPALAVSDDELAWWAELLANARNCDVSTVEGRVAVIVVTRLVGEARIEAEEIRLRRVAEERRLQEQAAERRRHEEAEQRRLEAERAEVELRRRQELEREERRRLQQLEDARRSRLRKRREADGDNTKAAFAAIITLLLPTLIGHLLWRQFLLDVAQKEPPDRRVMTALAWLVPDWAFGSIVIAGVLGIVLLRPPWPGRLVRVLVGALLIVTSLFAPSAANAITGEFRKKGMHDYTTGPISVAALGHTCGAGFSRRESGHGPFWRYGLVEVTNSSSVCSEMVGYRAWQRVWRLRASAAGFHDLGLYGGTLVAVQEHGGTTNGLVGVNRLTGKVRWRWKCPHGKNVSVVTYPWVGTKTDDPARVASISATCADGGVHALAFTGRPARA